MPKNTKVGKMFDAMRAEGMPKAKAAKIAQAKTGKSLKTGKTPKRNAAKTIAAGY